ncbi:hypothetical protein HZI73_22345 [Vallitalea pronyensis]|uniref:Uncharacterized protein n=1 Tax=Vallitalea pronyensis TaxID=1348613 RepID=A0A8J8MMY6_9FIRM|nr:hypothetical protein [Vallitalea pronyensis]QUI24872.1 hypothetical protein HZI73_22345 [Vallitalea pronyensis]
MTLTNDKVFDMLPFAVEAYEKLNIKKFVNNKALQKMKGEKEKGIALMMYIIKNVGLIKEEVYHLLAIVQEKNVEEIAKEDFFVTIQAFKEILNNKALLDFFKDAMQ